MFKKIIVMLALFLSGVVFITGMTISTASAAPVENCEHTGVINMYFGSDEDVVIGPGYDKNTFQEHDCDRNGMRIYKTVGNTKSEFVELKRFAGKHAYKNYPEAVCGNAERSRLYSLSYFYYRKYKQIKQVEKDYYKSWITRYAKNHDNCKLFATKKSYTKG